MEVTDYTKVEGITFKYPELFTTEGIQYICGLYDEIQKMDDRLYELREETIKLEESLKEKQKEWADYEPLVEIKYGKKEIEDYHNDLNLAFKFDSEINKSLH